MLETTIRQRLDAAKCVFSADTDRTYRDALALHHQSARFLERLIEASGRPAGGMRRTSVMLITAWLSAAWLLYQAECAAKGDELSGFRLDVRFLEWAKDRLPDGAETSNLRHLIRGSLSQWGETGPDPGAGPEVAGASYCPV